MTALIRNANDVTKAASIHDLYNTLRKWRDANKGDIRLDGETVGPPSNQSPWFYFSVGGLSPGWKGTYALNGDTTSDAVDRFLAKYEAIKGSSGTFPTTLDVLSETLTREGKPALGIQGNTAVSGWYCYQR